MRDTPELDAVKDDCLHLLMTAAALRHRASSFDLREAESRFEIHMWATELRALEQVLIVRICRFDDEGRNQTGFKAALRSIEPILPDDERKAANAALKQFRRTVNPLKTQERNRVVAHLDLSTPQKHDAKSLLSPAGLQDVLGYCRPVVQTVDLLADAKMTYTLQSGKHEQLDLREYCLIDAQV